MNTTNGRCHCGTVRWEFTLPVKTVVKCHCENCRKLQGSDYSTWAMVPSDQHSITAGNDFVTVYEDEEKSTKYFCSQCGCTAYLINRKYFPNEVVLALGLLENYREELAPQIQVFTPEKAPWVNLHEDEPIYS